jgi:hypothetical protein
LLAANEQQQHQQQGLETPVGVQQPWFLGRQLLLESQENERKTWVPVDRDEQES